MWQCLSPYWLPLLSLIKLYDTLWHDTEWRLTCSKGPLPSILSIMTMAWLYSLKQDTVFHLIPSSLKSNVTMHLTLSKVTPITPYNSHLSFYLLFHGKFLPSLWSYPILSPLPWQFFAILSPLPWQILTILSHLSPLPWQFLAIISNFIPSFIANYCHLIPSSMANSCLLIPLCPLFHGKFLPSYPRYMTVSLTLPSNMTTIIFII